MSNLSNRSRGHCELCSKNLSSDEYLVPPKQVDELANMVAVCSTCLAGIIEGTEDESNHWRCLGDSMWSEVSAVKVVSYRILKRLENQEWAEDLLNMIYLDEKEQEWADQVSGEKIVHKDSNGNILQNGDSVVLIKDLNVKGANFIAKRGTAVRRISLVHDNAEHIEGKVNTQHIVILTKFVKKT